MIENCNIGVIGSGNMGGALIAGLLKIGREPASITAVDLRDEVLEPLRTQGVKTSSDLSAAIQGQDVVVVAVKPQASSSILTLIGAQLQRNQLVVSIMAGVKTTTIEAQFAEEIPVVRVMPQTLVSEAVAASALCAGTFASAEHMSVAAAIFNDVGITVAVDETQMDAVTGLSGSGPAYVYTIIEAMADGGVRMGLSREVALKLAAQTVRGAAHLVCESGEHPAILRERVTSPGGTTIMGLHKLEEKGIRDALSSAVAAATARSAELGSA
jgi:pyrroline-5-carboxylate reductase